MTLRALAAPRQPAAWRFTSLVAHKGKAAPGFTVAGITFTGRSATMTRAVHVPNTVEQDEDGVWCAHAQLRPSVGANGEGDTPEAAIEDLLEALTGLTAEFGAPDELTLTLDVA